MKLNIMEKKKLQSKTLYPKYLQYHLILEKRSSSGKDMLTISNLMWLFL